MYLRGIFSFYGIFLVINLVGILYTKENRCISNETFYFTIFEYFYSLNKEKCVQNRTESLWYQIEFVKNSLSI